MNLLPSLPPLPRASGTDPGLITPATWNALLDYVAALGRRQSALIPQDSPDVGVSIESGGFKSHLKRRPQVSDAMPPLWPRFMPDPESSNHLVTVTPGVVYDHATISGAAIATYGFSNQFDSDGLKKFSITLGQCVYAHYYVDAEGAVLNASSYVPEIIVGAAGLAGTHYAPPIESSSGSAGDYYILLAQLEANDDGTYQITRSAAGDNISHYRELPMFQATGSGDFHPLFTEFNLATAKYKYKGLKAVAPLTLAESGSGDSKVLELSMATGANYNIVPYRLTFGAAYADAITATDLTPIIYIRNGISVPSNPGGSPNVDVVDIYRFVSEVYKSAVTLGGFTPHP